MASARKKSQGKECSFFNCTNRMYDASGNRTRFSFFCVPLDKETCSIWENRIGRKDGKDGFRITNATRVCSAHFAEHDLLRVPGGSRVNLRKGAVPLKWNQSPSESEKKRKLPAKRNQLSSKKVRRNLNPESVHVVENVVHVESLRVLATKATQSAFNALAAANRSLNDEIKYLRGKSHDSPVVSVDIIKSDKQCQHYTGFPEYEVFQAVFTMLNPGKNGENVKLISAPNAHPETGRGRKRGLSGELQFLLTLMRLRRGFTTEHLGWLFGCDKSTVSRLFVSWINFMYLRLTAIPIWPTREQVNKTMPKSFKDSYPETRVIIDCTELYCEAATSLELKGNMYSDYKGRETYKSLVGVTPSGSVSFVSQLYYGSLSDREIVERSGLLDPKMLDDGDEIMADKGFNIRDLTDKIGVKLNLPIFLGSRPQFEATETVINQRIASNRIHVERFINKVKKFRLIDGTIPLSLHGSVNQIWTVAVLLTLFHFPIISA